MKLYEVIQEARERGFTKVDDGAITWDIDNFEEYIIENVQDNSKEYSLHYNGNVYRFKEDGYQESVHVYRFFKRE